MTLKTRGRHPSVTPHTNKVRNRGGIATQLFAEQFYAGASPVGCSKSIKKLPSKELLGLQVIGLTLHVLETFAATISFSDNSLLDVLYFASRCLYCALDKK